MKLPRIGLGTMGIDDPDVIATALDLGYRHLDTAQIYENEAVVGEGLARSSVDRDDVVVATKVWADSLAPEDVHRSTTESLERLGLERIDLLYVHRPIDTYDPETTLPAFDELRDAGRIDNVGVSNFTIEQLETAHEILESPIAAHQFECHPLFHPRELIEHAQACGYHVVAYSPFAGGQLGELDAVREIANRYDLTPEATALGWLLAKDGVHVIPKASSREHLEANLEAQSLAFNAYDVMRIDMIERTDELFPE